MAQLPAQLDMLVCCQVNIVNHVDTCTALHFHSAGVPAVAGASSLLFVSAAHIMLSYPLAVYACISTHVSVTHSPEVQAAAVLLQCSCRKQHSTSPSTPKGERFGLGFAWTKPLCPVRTSPVAVAGLPSVPSSYKAIPQGITAARPPPQRAEVHKAGLP